MRFERVATFFDRDRCYDAYTGDFLFKAQFASYDGSQPDGSFQRRRTVSFAPGLVAPGHNCVTVYKENWILAYPIIDGFLSRKVRQTCSAKLATNIFDILTPGQAATGVPSTDPRFAQLQQLKDTVNTPTDSEYDSQFEVSMSLYEQGLNKGSLLRDTKSGELYLIRNTSRDVEGYSIITADILDNPTAHPTVKAGYVTFHTEGEMDLVTEERLPGISGTGILADMYLMYHYRTEAQDKNKSGDMSLLTAGPTYPGYVPMVTGMEITVKGGDKWQVLSVQAYRDGLLSHLRKV